MQRSDSTSRQSVVSASTEHVGRDVPHDSAELHVSGRSVFVDDMPGVVGELVAEIVPAPVAAGRLKSVDVSEAWKVEGVRGVMVAEDVQAGGGHNRFGPVIQDEDLVVEVGGVIQFLGQPVALIAAETREAAARARKAVRVEVEAGRAVLSIEQAMEAGAYFGQARHMSRGDVEAGFAEAERVLEGVFDIGGQEHFYLETQASIAIPGEQGTMTVHSSTQHPSEVQAMVAEALGVPFNHVTCLCRRMGGGFGGKETQAAQPAMIAALLARRTGRAVRFVYNRDDDMAFTGKRHPFKAVWRAGFRGDGRVTAVDLKLYSNGGCSTDLSFAVLERAMLHSDNAYFLPAVRIKGRVCRTNLPSNTAFRGFGGPQGVAAIENIMEQGAQELGLDALAVRRANLYGVAERNTTHYGQVVGNNMLPRLMEELAVEAGYEGRRREVTEFNARSRTKLKGLAMTPVKFGISFTRRTLNQANALVNIYLDGSVAVSTGATEMGQGVHTRIRQLVAEDLGLGLDRVMVQVTSTDKNNNTSPTAASTGTDLNGAAALDATSRLKERLAEVAAQMLASPGEGLAAEASAVRFSQGYAWDTRQPGARVPFGAVVKRAYELRVSLGERGFYVTPGVDFNRETGRGTPFLYFTQGAACSEVLIDRLTGQMKLMRVDLLMDVGQSINPGIDRGQIVGGFAQGFGWCTMEELVYAENGALLTHSPDTYKLPSIDDMPEVLNVRFIDNPDSHVSIRRSKAVGEPPLLLGLSVWAAVKNGVGYWSKEGAKGLRLPATGEQILRALG